eukprot:PhM_4_TR410/c0_g1_i2/m.23503
MNPAKKPQLLVCYLCGQQFGTSSLPIHMPQCYDKKIVEWQNADPKNRGPRPRPPHKKVDPNDIPKSLDDDAEVEQFNNRQFGNFTDNMAQCQNCGRKFLADRLEVHLRSCKPGQGSKPIAGKRPQTQGGRSGSSAGESGPARKPQLLVCYLCGQQFGTSSLRIHIPQCYQKRLVQWKAADPNVRGPAPRDPATMTDADFASMSQDEKVQFNNEQFSDFNNNMSKCDKCGRTFLPDRLAVHQRSCKGGAQGSKPVNARPHTSAGPDVPNPASSPKKVFGAKARTADAPEQKHLSSTTNLQTSTSQRVLMSLRFEDVDINGDGLIDKEELKAVLSDIGFSASNEEVDSFLGLYDTDDDGMINLADWESANFGEKILHFTGSDQATVPHAVP